MDEQAWAKQSADDLRPHLMAMGFPFVAAAVGVMEAMLGASAKAASAALEVLVEVAKPLLAEALMPIADLVWAWDEEVALREYARRMNAGRWKWRRRSWRRLNRVERAEARLWWNRTEGSRLKVQG